MKETRHTWELEIATLNGTSVMFGMQETTLRMASLLRPEDEWKWRTIRKGFGKRKTRTRAHALALSRTKARTIRVPFPCLLSSSSTDPRSVSCHPVGILLLSFYSPSPLYPSSKVPLCRFGQIEICAGHLRCLRNLVSAQANSKFARVCASPRKYLQ